MALTKCKRCSLEWQADAAGETCPRCERDSLREALTPSANTKAAYIGEFSWKEEVYDDEGESDAMRTITVPWDTTKDIMKAIRQRGETVSNWEPGQYGTDPEQIDVEDLYDSLPDIVDGAP